MFVGKQCHHCPKELFTHRGLRSVCQTFSTTIEWPMVDQSFFNSASQFFKNMRQAGIAKGFAVASWKRYENILPKHIRFHHFLLIVRTVARWPVVTHLLDNAPLLFADPLHVPLYSFFPNTITLWNSFPFLVVHSPSISAFKIPWVHLYTETLVVFFLWVHILLA